MEYYGLIGNPVSHSLSEKYFTDKFMLEDIDARFEAYLLPDIDSLPKLLASLPQIRGLNVTSPFKTEVIKYCDLLDPVAGSIKAVNTLRMYDLNGKRMIHGYNTDVHGFTVALLAVIGNNRPGALILGSGGAARAAAYAMNRLGMSFKVVSRHHDRGKITYSELTSELMSSHKLLINATPLGMGSLKGMLPEIPYEQITSGHILLDLIYNPPETPFLQEGKKRGAHTQNGLLMLQAQAEKAWGIWSR